MLFSLQGRDVCFWGESRHLKKAGECPFMTQSGHSGPACQVVADKFNYRHQFKAGGLPEALLVRFG